MIASKIIKIKKKNYSFLTIFKEITKNKNSVDKSLNTSENILIDFTYCKSKEYFFSKLLQELPYFYLLKKPQWP